MRSFEEIKTSTSLSQFLERTTGLQPQERSGNYIKYHNPFRASHDNFVVYDDIRWVDFSQSDERGDIFDLIIKLGFAPDRKGALAYLEGGSASTYTPPQKQAKKQNKPLTFEQAQRWAQWGDVAATYWTGRGLSPETVKNWMLGVGEWSHEYKLKTGEIIRHSAPRFTIPYLRFGKDGKPIVATVNRRLNTTWADDYIKNATGVTAASISKVMLDLAEKDMERGREPDLSTQRLIKVLFGDKYMRIGPSVLFNAHLIIKWHANGTWEWRKPPYVIVTEDEASALSFVDRGYIAVSGKQSHTCNLSKALAHVQNVFLAYNSDARGQEFAAKAKAVLPQAHILPLLDGFKDPNEMLQAGKLDTWAKRYPAIVKVNPEYLVFPKEVV